MGQEGYSRWDRRGRRGGIGSQDLLLQILLSSIVANFYSLKYFPLSPSHSSPPSLTLSFLPYPVLLDPLRYGAVWPTNWLCHYILYSTLIHTHIKGLTEKFLPLLKVQRRRTIDTYNLIFLNFCFIAWPYPEESSKFRGCFVPDTVGASMRKEARSA